MTWLCFNEATLSFFLLKAKVIKKVNTKCWSGKVRLQQVGAIEGAAAEAAALKG